MMPKVMSIRSTSGVTRSFSARRPCRRAMTAPRAAFISDPVATVAAFEGFRSSLVPTAQSISALNLPDWLIHWGHPGNMMVVLLAMGGYGTVYQGWQIRVGTDEEAIVKAKDMHPKLALGMTFFFAAGAFGGVLSMVMQDKPILDSPHAVTGLVGLTLLSFQAMLPLFFAEQPGTRTAHALLGTSIFALFCIHAALGLNLGVSI